MFDWDEKYSVGIQSIDSQHKELFRQLDNLLLAMKRGEGQSAISGIIQELDHFQKEEFFFQRFNYSESSEHIKEHRNFIQKVAELRADLKLGKAILTVEVMNFLKGWIDHHILEVDNKYIECFRKNGLK
jgi:hemerythrin-like metal-binding protein